MKARLRTKLNAIEQYIRGWVINCVYHLEFRGLRQKRQIPLVDERWIQVLLGVLGVWLQENLLVSWVIFHIVCRWTYPWCHECSHRMAWTMNNSFEIECDAESETYLLRHTMSIITQISTRINNSNIMTFITGWQKKKTYEGVYIKYLRSGKTENTHFGTNSKLQCPILFMKSM